MGMAGSDHAALHDSAMYALRKSGPRPIVPDNLATRAKVSYVWCLDIDVLFGQESSTVALHPYACMMLLSMSCYRY